jgi:hypothetical protein
MVKYKINKDNLRGFKILFKKKTKLFAGKNATAKFQNVFGGMWEK